MLFTSVRTAVYALFLFLLVAPAGSQSLPAGSAGNGHLWNDVSEQVITSQVRSGTRPRRDIIPRKYRTVQVDKAKLKNLLASVVPETTGPIETTGTEFEIPHPRGGFHRFLIQESPIMEPKLAARFTEFKTYI